MNDELEKLEALQERLYAEHARALLIVFQGMDTAGKDGAIKDLGRGIHPLGVRTVAFKVPTAEELAHDFLWRVHKQVPACGEIVFFNRSHYEDVIVVRVEKLAPRKIWYPRFEQINRFEQILTETGTTVVKFFLHISKEEQKQRLEARRDDATKRWKFSVDDLQKRKRWNAYMRAYRDVLERTSTRWAPWTVVPSNHKWYRSLVVARHVVRVLERMSPKYPKPRFDPRKVVIP